MATFDISLAPRVQCADMETGVGRNAICQIKSIMKTGKLMFGWVILASLFTAVEALFSPQKAGYRVRRILERGERLIGVQGGIGR